MSKIKNEKLADAIKSHYDTLANKILPQSEEFSTQLLEFHKKEKEGSSFIIKISVKSKRKFPM